MGFKPCSKHAISSCASQVLEALGAAVSGAVAMGAGNWDMWGMTAGGALTFCRTFESHGVCR